MFITRTTTLAASALLLLTLAACTPGGGGGTAEGATGGEEPSGGTENCLTNTTWKLDLADAAAQVGEHLGSSGLAVTEAIGEGRHDIRFDEDGTAASHIDVTYTISVVDGELNLTIVQTHSGEMSGEWQQDSASGDVSFPTWNDGEYTVQTQTIVNGTASETTTSVPDEGYSDGSVMSTDCSGDALTTKVSASPFTHHWTAER